MNGQYTLEKSFYVSKQKQFPFYSSFWLQSWYKEKKWINKKKENCTRIKSQECAYNFTVYRARRVAAPKASIIHMHAEFFL